MKRETRARILLGIYLAVMLWLLLLGRESAGWSGESFGDHLAYHANIIPLKSIRAQLGLLAAGENRNLTGFAIRNLCGNLLLFIPLGLLLPESSGKLRRPAPTVLGSALFILCVELVQLFTLCGCFDVDDILLNTWGVALGYGIYCLLHVRKRG